ncbi:MAG TPA: hypothetical protein VKE69_14335 [Planctomycetota bacterium]|nr:hypothetical protein [Planctomycetota bacterium]
MRFAPLLFLDAPPGEPLPRETASELRAALRHTARHEDARLNVAATLDFLEAADRGAYREPIAELRELAAAKRVEFAATAARRECLPLLPPAERRRLVERGIAGCAAVFGADFAPSVLVPPDLAYDRFVARLARDLGLSAVVVDASSYVGGSSPGTNAFVVDGLGVRALFAHRALDDAVHSGVAPTLQVVLAFHRGATPILLLFEPGEPPSGEKGPAEFLDRALGSGQVETVRLTSLLASTTTPASIDPIPSSRRTGRIDLATGAPFARWSAPRHPIHADLQALRERMFEAARSANGAARAAVDEAIGSAPLAAISCRPDFEPERALAGVARIERALAACGALDESAAARVAGVRSRIERWTAGGTAADLARRFREAGEDGNPIPETGVA